MQHDQRRRREAHDTEPRWATRNTRCANCLSDRFPHKARGFCDRCYVLIRRIETVEAWRLEIPSSLRGYPRDDVYWNSESFERVKPGHLKQLRARLYLYREWERLRKGRVEPLYVEGQLNCIAMMAGARRRNLFHGMAGSLEDTFSKRQLDYLYRLLNDIEQAIPWRGIDLNRIFADGG